MPNVERQTSTGAGRVVGVQPVTPAAKARPGSILSEAVSVGQLEDDFIKIVIYGRNRVGKTHLAGGFPKPLLLISFEPGRSGGARTVKGQPGIQFIHIVAEGQKDHRGVVQKEPASAKARRLAEELRAGCPFKTVVLDTVTSYQDLILQEIMGLDAAIEQLNFGAVSKDQYRERSERTRTELRPFLNIDAHTVVLAQEKDHNPPRDEGGMSNKLLRGLQHESFFAADLGGATAKWLHDNCDYVAQLFVDHRYAAEAAELPLGAGAVEEVREVGLVRRLRCVCHPNFAAGFRSEHPEAVPEFIDDPDFAKIEAVIRGEKLTRAPSTKAPPKAAAPAKRPVK